MTRTSSLTILAAALAASACGGRAPNEAQPAPRSQAMRALPASGQDLVRQMRRDGRTYRSLTFVQTTTFPDRPSETWWESALMPGMLRIDTSPLDSQRVMIYRNDSLYVSRIGRPWRGRPQVHSLLVLLGDVFMSPADSTIAKLTGLGFDLSKIREDTWEGRRHFVVGTTVRGDSTTPQFWIDAERLALTRVIEVFPGQNGGVFDGRVTRHQQFDGYDVETEMVFYLNGREIQREVYNDVHVNPELDPAIFVPGASYVRPSWIRP